MVGVGGGSEHHRADRGSVVADGGGGSVRTRSSFHEASFRCTLEGIKKAMSEFETCRQTDKTRQIDRQAGRQAGSRARRAPVPRTREPGRMHHTASIRPGNQVP